MNPIVSVIVPVYNVEKYLSRCLESIINQTYRNLEIILINDGSKDGSGEICDTYARKDRRIQVIHKENGGLSDARNTGLDLAKGEYIGFVDSDDYIHLDMYSLLLDAIKENSADVAEVGCKKIFDAELNNDGNCGEGERIYTRMGGLVSTIVDHDCRNYSVNKLYKRKLWENIRFPKGKIYEDAFTTYKVVNEASKLVKLERDMYFYYQREDSISNATFSLGNLHHCEALEEMMDFIIKKYPAVAPITCIKYYSSCLHWLQILNKSRGSIENADCLIADLREKLVDGEYRKYLKKSLNPLCEQLLTDNFGFLIKDKFLIKARLMMLEKSMHLFSLSYNFIALFRNGNRKRTSMVKQN